MKLKELAGAPIWEISIKQIAVGIELAELLKTMFGETSEFKKSNSEITRVWKSGGVRVNGIKQTFDMEREINILDVKQIILDSLPINLVRIGLGKKEIAALEVT